MSLLVGPQVAKPRVNFDIDPSVIMSTPKACVETIRKEIELSRDARLWQDSINMLNTVSESIFSRSAHFILELLQNAEDACARINNHSGEIKFIITPSHIRVVQNGAAFDDEDVSAICGVRSSKKPEQGTLGYLGIGFKSVFKVTDCPKIHSGGYHFKFDKSQFTDPANEPWQIIPIWLDGFTAETDTNATLFLLPFKDQHVYDQTREELDKLDVHIFLFLKWLKRLVIVDQLAAKTQVIENLGETNGVVSLRRGQRHSRFVVFRRIVSVPPDVATDPALEFYRRQKVKQREVVLAFGVDENGNLRRIEEASTLGSVSSFLPLVEEKSGAKFLVQSDFLVQPGREAIQYELAWNQWLLHEAAELGKDAIEQFKLHPAWGGSFSHSSSLLSTQDSRHSISYSNLNYRTHSLSS